MIKRNQLEKYLHNLLNVDTFKDFTSNGLQIEGSNKIRSIMVATSASFNVIQKINFSKIDALLVHHGFFWKNENTQLTNGYKKKVKILFDNDINLFAYHLPLDAHKKYGNNYPVLKYLNCKKIENMADIGYIGTLKNPVLQKKFFQKLDSLYSNKGTHIANYDSKKKIRKIAIVSGGGQSYLNNVIEYNRLIHPKKRIDAFITGEGTEWVTSLCKENDLCYSAMGHNKSEEIGVQLLGKHLAKKFNLKYNFIKDNNPF